MAPSPSMPRRTWAIVLAAATFSAVLTGCGLLGDDDADRPDGVVATTEATTSTVPESDVVLEVIDAGEQPRLIARTSYTEGDVVLVSFTTDIEIDQEVDGVAQRVDSPPITQILRYQVGAVDDDRATVAIDVVSATVDGEGSGLTGEEIVLLQAEVDQVVGTATTVEVGPDGSTSGDALGSTGPALPLTAIGVGAIWEVTTPDQITRYTATEVSSLAISYTAEVTITGPSPGTGTMTGTLSLVDPSLDLTSTTSTESPTQSTEIALRSVPL